MPTSGCPHCNSADIARRRRSGLFDRIRATFNKWPYRCLACDKLFHGSGRQPVYRTKPAAKPRSQDSKKPPTEATEGPRAAYQTAPSRPYAKIMLETETHEQMDAILLALSRAVATHHGSTREHAQSSRRAHA